MDVPRVEQAGVVYACLQAGRHRAVRQQPVGLKPKKKQKQGLLAGNTQEAPRAHTHTHTHTHTHARGRRYTHVYAEARGGDLDHTTLHWHYRTRSKHTPESSGGSG